MTFTGVGLAATSPLHNRQNSVLFSVLFICSFIFETATPSFYHRFENVVNKFYRI